VNRVLVQVIAQLASFLEFAGEDVLELEAAVKQQEDMAFKLQQLTAAERAEFIRLLNQVADESPFAAERAYLRSLPELLGIA
jgi:acyl-CoA reductase-like NAD-dependent aldehyde dehydrogenase